jgi:hypothetical protein
LLVAVAFIGVVAAGDAPGEMPDSTPISTTVPPDCDPPKLCPVLVDTDQDGYSDYDEEAYGSDPGDPASTPESWAFGTCEDGADNDRDGAADGEDGGCSDPCASPTPTPMTPTGYPDYYPYCDRDSDGDGFFDSDEINSGSDPDDPASTPEDWGHGACEDGLDNDLDGPADGEDAGCAEICGPPPPTLPPEPGPESAPEATPAGTPVDGGGGGSAGSGACSEDSDRDGYADWDEWGAGSDPNDAGSTPEAIWYPGTCEDGADNDLDGLADGEDDACSFVCVWPEMPPEPNGGQTAGGGSSPAQPCIADSDGDGIDDGTEEMLGSDAQDADSTPEHLKWLDSCGDGTDNDGDSLADAADPGCQPDADDDGVPDTADNCPQVWNPDQGDANQDGTGDACQDSDGDGHSDAEEASWGSDPNDSASTPEVFWVAGACEDGQDNDGDGATDAADSGCAFPEPLMPGAGMPPEFVAKDANCDLVISARDALVILRSAAGLAQVTGESFCTVPVGGTAPGDVDCSGFVDLADSLAVLKYVGGLTTAPGLC